MQLSREKLHRQLNRYVPITAWLPAYPRDLLRTDIISGVTVWGVRVPVAMAYAQMAGLPPQVGLYTAFAALLGYAIFGTSRQLKVTASSTMAVMSSAVVAAMAFGDPARYGALSAALAVTVGVILLAAGIVRLGFISDFLSKSVVTGLVFGLARLSPSASFPSSSASGTALNISSAAKSRWANVFSGLLEVLAVLLFSRAVSLVAMPAMAAPLIVAGAQSIKSERIADVWDTRLGPAHCDVGDPGADASDPTAAGGVPRRTAVDPGSLLRHLFAGGAADLADPQRRRHRH